MALADLFDPNRVQSKFLTGQKQEKEEWRRNGLPEGFLADGAHIRRGT